VSMPAPPANRRKVIAATATILALEPWGFEGIASLGCTFSDHRVVAVATYAWGNWPPPVDTATDHQDALCAGGSEQLRPVWVWPTSWTASALSHCGEEV
jgi:hypothetical protein